MSREEAGPRLVLAKDLSRPIDHQSKRGSVVDAFLTAIDSQELRPGQKLTVSTLARQFGVSAATVREALATLKTLNIIEDQANRPSRVITPTSTWYVAMMAECAGLSCAATDLGIAHASEEQRSNFAAAAALVQSIYAAGASGQFATLADTWDLMQLLATFSKNRYIAHLHYEKRYALALGTRHLSRPLNLNMLLAAVDALSLAVRQCNRDEGVEIVRDLYEFVTVPYALS